MQTCCRSPLPGPARCSGGQSSLLGAGHRGARAGGHCWPAWHRDGRAQRHTSTASHRGSCANSDPWRVTWRACLADSHPWRVPWRARVANSHCWRGPGRAALPKLTIDASRAVSDALDPTGEQSRRVAGVPGRGLERSKACQAHRRWPLGGAATPVTLHGSLLGSHALPVPRGG